MRIESAEQGVRFEWDGEPSTVVAVGLKGLRADNYERMELLHASIWAQRHSGVRWVDLEMRERFITGEAAPRKPGESLLLWRGQFEDWKAAAVAFTVLCEAIGVGEPDVDLEITP